MTLKRAMNYLPEPRLLFGHNQLTEDPRDGLTLYGPYESSSKGSIQVGVIGSPRGLELYSKFVERLQSPLYSPAKEVTQRPHFPGFENVFGVRWPSNPTASVLLKQEEVAKALETSNLKERTYAVVNIYLEKLVRFQAEEEQRIDLWFVVLPRNVWVYCRPESKSSGEISIGKAAIEAHMAGQQVMFPEIAEEIEESIEVLDSSSDFHNQLKARVLKEKLQAPIQVILESTLEFRDRHRLQEYDAHMKAHLAWTQSSAIYYKLGKLPWKLHGVREGVCYVGLTFRRFERAVAKGYACSAAQMFLDSGDGTVFKGNIGPWLSKDEKDYHLDTGSAKDLLEKAILSYISRKGREPQEIFIHGRARFSQEEWNGFREAISENSPNTRLTGVVIQSSGKLKLFRHVSGESSNYGVLRGLMYQIDSRQAYLWTRGFIPRLQTSISLEIPNPLRIQIDRGNGQIEQVCQDVLALSKLNYNACIYGDGLPVTLRFSDNVGSILTAIDGLEVEVLPFKYYI